MVKLNSRKLDEISWINLLLEKDGIPAIIWKEKINAYGFNGISLFDSKSIIRLLAELKFYFKKEATSGKEKKINEIIEQYQKFNEINL